MQNFICPYYHDQEVRAIDFCGATWFVAADLCKGLELESSGGTARALAPLEDDEKGITIVNTLGGPQQMSIVSKAGLYSLLFLSRKPGAKKFKRWVTHEVLPAIEREGVYAPNSLLNIPANGAYELSYDQLVGATQPVAFEIIRDSEVVDARRGLNGIVYLFDPRTIRKAMEPGDTIRVTPCDSKQEAIALKKELRKALAARIKFIKQELKLLKLEKHILDLEQGKK